MRKSVIVLLVFAGLVLACPPLIWARGGLLKQPSLALPANIAGRQAVMNVIRDPKFQFVGGTFLNARSALRYAGNANALNAFVARLASCPGAKLEMRFERGNESDATWTLAYDPSRDASAFVVIVNSRRVPEGAVKVPKA